MRLLILLTLVVLVSGCIQAETFLAQIGGTSSIEGKGLSITEFSSMPSQQYSGRNVRLSLTLENTGGNSTGNVLACLSGENFIGSTSLGKYKEGYWETTEYICKKTRGLIAPDVSQDIPGGLTTVKWTVTAPAIPEGMTITDMFTARTFFDYSTKASLSITAVSESERISIEQKGETIQTYKVDKTLGPIDINLEVNPQPIILFDSEAYANIKITLKNIGKGTVFDSKEFSFSDSRKIPVIEENELNKVYLNINSPKEVSIDCFEDLTKAVEMFKDTLIMSCDVTVKDSTLTTKKSYPIFISATYGYYIDVPLRVGVVSRPGMPVITPTVPEEEEVDYYSFDTHDALDVYGLDEKDISFTFSDTVDYWIERQEYTDWQTNTHEDDLSKKSTKNIDFSIVKKSDYTEYDKINFLSRPKLSGKFFKSLDCNDKTTEDSLNRCEKETNGYIWDDVSFDDIRIRKYSQVDVGEERILGTYTTIKENTGADTQAKIILQMFNPTFDQGTKTDIPIEFKFKGTKSEDGKTITSDATTRTLTLHMKEKDYSQEFSVKHGEIKKIEFAEGEYNSNNYNYKSTCEIQINEIDNTQADSRCEPEYLIKCTGGLLNLDEYTEGTEQFVGKIIQDKTIGSNKIGIVNDEVSTTESENYPPSCNGKSITLKIATVDIDCKSDNLGNCLTDDSCKDYEYKFKLSIDGLSC